jgi:hypothetical protein
MVSSVHSFVIMNIIRWGVLLLFGIVPLASVPDGTPALDWCHVSALRKFVCAKIDNLPILSTTSTASINPTRELITRSTNPTIVVVTG